MFRIGTATGRPDSAAGGGTPRDSLPRFKLLRRLVVLLGVRRAVVAVCAGAVLFSLGTTQVLLQILQPATLRLFWVSTTISVLAPLLVAPPWAWLISKLVLTTEAARRLAQRRATTDALTGALNRRQFFALGERDLARAAGAGQAVALMLLDVDHFKSVNDRHGHAAGDEVLKQLAEACTQQLRPYDLLARLGGEEFAVLLVNVSQAQALRTAERVRLGLQALALAMGGDAVVRPTVSIGLAFDAAVRASLDALLSQADQAMYAAKQGGRNRVCLATAPPAAAPVGAIVAARSHPA